ncbi:MAG TPA: DUF4328 domain-containing protein [Polyangiaceae bacterium]|jgi:hypothetical protein
MTAYNPYLAPQVPQNPQAYAPAWAQEQYVPLGWRTMLATLAIAAAAFFGVVLDVVQLAFADQMKGESPDMGSALVVFFVAMAFLGALVAAAVFFGIWVHRASKNLRGLGRQGMQYTPGWCVGWFYVPFANLVRPFKALSEIWRASESDAESDGSGWSMMGSSTALLGMWWGTWLAGNIFSNISGRVDDPSVSGGIGLLGSGLLLVAAVTCVLLMRGISSRQAATAERLGAGASTAQV